MKNFDGLDIVEIINSNVEYLGFLIEKAANYYQDVEKFQTLLKRSVNGTTFNKNTLTTAAIKSAIEYASLNAQNQIYSMDSEMRSGSDSVDYRGSPADDATVQATGKNIHSATKSYQMILVDSYSCGNPVQDYAIKLMGALLQFEEEVIKAMGIYTIINNGLEYFNFAFSDSSGLDTEQMANILAQSDKFDAYMDQLWIDDEGKFDPEATFNDLLEKALRGIEFDSTQAAAIFDDNEKEDVQDLFTLLRNTDQTIIPEELKQYSYMYQDVVDINYLLTEECKSVNDIFGIIDKYSDKMPDGIRSAYEKISGPAKEIVEIFSGGISNSVKNVNDAIVAAMNCSIIPEEIKSVLSTVQDINGFKEALINGTPAELQPYLDKIKDFAGTFQSLNSLNQLPGNLLNIMGNLSENVGTVLKQFKDLNIDKIKDFVNNIVDYTDLSNIDKTLGNLVDNLPQGIKDLNLNNLADFLGVNTQISAIIDRIGFLEYYDKIPKSLSDLTATLGVPSEVSNIINKAGDLLGVNKVFDEIQNMIGLDQITKPIQDVIDDVLGNFSIGNILETFQSGNFTNIIDNISGLAGNFMDKLGELSAVPAKIGQFITDIPDKISGMIDNIGGMISNIDFGNLISQGITTLGPMLIQMLPPEAQKVVQIASTVLSMFGFDFGLGGMFGGGQLGRPLYEKEK